MTVAEHQIPEIVERVKRRLAELGRERNVPLRVEDRDYKLDDDWLFVSVGPSQPNVRASEYAELMTIIERELRADNIDNVLLTPTINDLY